MCLFSSVCAFGQNNLIENAVKNGFFIIRQNYVLKEKSTGMYFTRKGKDELSYTYSLAVKTDSGYLIGEQAVTPWKYDENYKEVPEPEKYTPVISYTLVSELKKELNFFKIDTGKIVPVSGKLFLTTDVAAGNTALPVYNQSNKNLYEVWVKVSDLADLDNNSVDFQIEVKQQNKYKQAEGNYFGGILVSVNYPSLGKIEIQLAGIFMKDGSAWKTVMLPEKLPSVEIKAETPSSGNKMELAPVKTDQPAENQEEPQNTNDKKKKKK